MALSNKSLGEFNLEGIPNSPRGTPQIEVTFDIDANGILHVGAKDKATGKENKITIKANSGLNEDEIERMVRDAEANAEEDNRLKELAEIRNQGDSLLHSTKKALEEHGQSLDQNDKEKIEIALKDLEESLKGQEKSEIESNIEKLSKSAQKLGEKAYSDLNSQASAAPNTSPSDAESKNNEPKPKDDDVVDADFKEVKDK